MRDFRRSPGAGGRLVQGCEFATIPSLPDITDWEALESARLLLRPKLSLAHPASRYAVARSEAA